MHCGSDETTDPRARERDAMTTAEAEAGGSSDAEASLEAATASCVAVKAFQVSEVAGASRAVRVAWNGNGYGLAWSDDRGGTQQIYFARLDASGQKIGADVRVTDLMFDAGFADGGPARFLGVSALIWTGTEYGLFWKGDGLSFATLDANGKPSPAVFIEPVLDGNARQIVWNGSGYGVAWYDNHEGDFEVYFYRLDMLGKKLGTDVRVTNSPGNSFTPSLARAGSNYGLAWHDNRTDAGYQIFFSQLDALGVETIDDVQISTTPAGGARLAGAGAGYGLVWGSPVTFVRLDGAGKKVGQEITLTAGASAVGIEWTGRGFAVSQIIPGVQGAVPLSLALTDSTGTKLGSDSVLSNTASDQTAVSVVGLAGGAAVGWIDKTADSTEVSFAVVCP